MCFYSTFFQLSLLLNINQFIWLLSFLDDNVVNEAVSFLQEEIISLKGLELIAEQVEPGQPTPESSEPVVETPSVAVKEHKSADKKTLKPKWLKM